METGNNNSKIMHKYHVDTFFVKLKTKPKPIVQTKSKELYWLYKNKNKNIPHCIKNGMIVHF